MPVIFALGRVFFVLIFVVSGAQKLLDMPGTAATIDAKFALPDVLAGPVAQAAGALGMTASNLLAATAGVVELVGGLLMMFNLGTRVVALVLLLYTALATYVFHNFWTMTGEARADTMVQAMKDLSLIGGFLVFFVLGSWRPVREPPL